MFITFYNPIYLYGFFVIPVLVLFHFLTLRSRRKASLKFANFEAIAHIKGVDFYSKHFSVLIFSILLSSMLVLALSGTTLHMAGQVSDYSFVIALDVSESMVADDIQPTRLDAAKAQAISFVENAPSGMRIGFVSFSGNAVIEQAITDNHQLLVGAIQRQALSSVSGTDINEAVTTSVNLLEGEKNKAIILLSDGQINVGKIDNTILYAQQHDTVVHTLALGTSEGGSVSYGISKVDESSLQALAYGTKGIFMNGTSSKAIGDYFSEVLVLKEGYTSLDITSYLIMAAVVMFLLLYFMMNTYFRALP